MTNEQLALYLNWIAEQVEKIYDFANKIREQAQILLNSNEKQKSNTP